MASWKNDEIAAEVFRGNVTPKTRALPLRIWLLGLGAAMALLAVIFIVQSKPARLPAAAHDVSEAEAPAAAKSVEPGEEAAVTKDKPAEPEVIVLPPITLSDKANSSPPGASRGNAGAVDAAGAVAALEEAHRLEAGAAGDMAAREHARALYQQALDGNKLEPTAEKQCLERLLDLTNRLVLDPKTACTAPQAIFHKVETGDVLEKIARKYKVNQGQLKRINHLNDKLMVRYEQVLKILPGDVLFRVDRSRLVGTLYIAEVFIRRYPIGIGSGNATPKGVYNIERKVLNPDWYYAGKRIPFGDPANILGSRWMAFSETDNGGQGGGLGIHGTSLPQTVPGRESKGCIRMINQDVEELYDFMPQGGKVEISD